jgi:hypothetical protein
MGEPWMFERLGVWALGGRWGVLRRLSVSLISGMEPGVRVSADGV